MGRSYSFEPFRSQQPSLKVQGSGPRLGNDEDKQKVTQQADELPDAPVKFRQKNAETVKRYQRRHARRVQAGASGAAAANRKSASTARGATGGAKKKAAAAPRTATKTATKPAAKPSRARPAATAAKPDQDADAGAPPRRLAPVRGLLRAVAGKVVRKVTTRVAAKRKVAPKRKK